MSALIAMSNCHPLCYVLYCYAIYWDPINENSLSWIENDVDLFKMHLWKTWDQHPTTPQLLHLNPRETKGYGIVHKGCPQRGEGLVQIPNVDNWGRAGGVKSPVDNSKLEFLVFLFQHVLRMSFMGNAYYLSIIFLFFYLYDLCHRICMHGLLHIMEHI